MSPEPTDRQPRDELEMMVEMLEQKVAERTDQLRNLALVLSSAERSERQRMAELIHGELQQLLTAALMKTDRLGARLTDEKSIELKNEVRSLICQTAGFARSVSVELSPPILLHGGLVESMEWLVGWMKERHDLTVQADIDHSVKVDSEEIKIHLFESVRELLFNVIKHAKTDLAKLTLRRHNDNQCLIRVEDGGVGCESEILGKAGTSDGSFGLFNISERLKMLGCEIRFDSAPGDGFCAEIVAPTALTSEMDFPSAGISSIAEIAEIGEKIYEQLSDDGSEEVQLPENSMIRIGIVEDHRIVLEGFVSLFDDELDMEVVAEASDGIEAIEMARQHRPDIILMDVNMPRMGGIESTKRIVKEFPNIKVIGLSVNNDTATEMAMKKAGAVAYFVKDAPSDELCDLIRNVI